MPIKLIAPLEKDFTLDRSDARYGTDGEPTRLTIRQATQAQHERRSAIYSEITQYWDKEEGDVRLRQHWTMEQLKRVETFLTLVGCNLKGEDGNPMFRFKQENGRQVLDMSDADFATAWGMLPPDMASEIHEKVLKVNLDWAGPLANAL